MEQPAANGQRVDNRTFLKYTDSAVTEVFRSPLKGAILACVRDRVSGLLGIARALLVNRNKNERQKKTAIWGSVPFRFTRQAYVLRKY